jgi:hypothetical protein
MASILSSILSALQGKSVVTFVNELTGTQCWTDANVKDVEIVSDSDNAEMPLSTEQVNETSVYSGLLAADVKTSKIIKPVRLKATVLTSNLSLVENILSLFADTTVTIGVTSKSIVSSSMAISHVAIEQTPDMLSASKVTVLFEQTQPPQPSTFDPAQTADASTLGLGIQNLNPVGPSLSSIGGGVGSLISTGTTAVGSLYQRFIQNIGL